MRKVYLFICLVLVTTTVVYGQKKNRDSLQLFADDVPIQVTIVTDINKMIRTKNKAAYQKAQWIGKLPDSTAVDEAIRLKARGNFRLQNCYFPSLKLNFHNATSPLLYPLNELKMVASCNGGEIYNQLVLKEYLVYKMYNQLTNMSFKVRLLNISFRDSENKKDPYFSYGFLIEDVKDMAARNKCKEFTGKLMQEVTDRKQMTLVALFQYLIGNTDWQVPVFHNIKLIIPKKDSLQRPYTVPYDFDFAGIVNAPYASPSKDAEPFIRNVTDRWYMGYTRTAEELQECIDLFNSKKEAMLGEINNCAPLSASERNEMIRYINQFYDMINDKGYVRRTFIEGTNF